MRNLYDVLGVARDADQATIRKSFKKLARENHPDLKQDDPAATERFKEISAAYEVLGDEEKRSLYDEFGEVSLKPGFDAERARQYKSMGGGMGGGFGGGGFGFGGESVSFEDLFGNLFRGGAAGGRRAAPRAARGADIESALRVSLLDAIRG
ncbi:MAG: J domain-containing protein, partial [Mycobacterium sp.]|nr:J domain-containing protein [Mycobacterium sp.]